MASLDSEKPDAEIGNEPGNEKAGMHYYYSNRIWRCFADLFSSNDSNLPTRNSNPCLRSLTAAFRKRRSGLPILLHPNAVRSSPIAVEASKLCLILEDIKEHTLSNLHQIHKSLAFWQARAMETDFQKMWFMVFNRGPLAFIHQSFQIIKRLSTNGHPYEHISGSAYETISSKIIILTTLQRCLAAFLAQVYLEVNKFGELLIADPEKSLPTLLKAVDCLFCKLEASINQSCEIYNVNNVSFSTESRNSCVLIFLKLPNMERIQTQWEECEIRDAASLIQENLQRLQAFLSILLSRCQKPNRMTAFWFHYTCGAVLFSTFSFWVLRHSRLMGSSDIDNWILAAKESTTTFWEEHVEQPLISIRDDLFETFRKRHKGVMEIEEVQLTSSSLHRMLLAFSEQTKGQKVPENLTDQEMMEIVMSRYEKELMHPLQNLISGELARAMLIQIQKLKLDLETAMLELDQILKANEINFAVLAALPAFFISLILLFLVRTWVFQDKGAEGRGRIARIRRRLLLVEVEDWIMQYQACLEEGTEEDAGWMLGMMLYSLDLLCKAVEKNAKDTHEWPRLRQDIIKLMKPEVKIDHKLAVILRMGRMYDCLLPFSRQR